jgi:hypothetical protein
MARAGLTGVKAQYFNPVGALGWLLVARILRRPHLSAASVRISERLAVPSGRGLQRLFRPPFGQSVLAVGSVPSEQTLGLVIS